MAAATVQGTWRRVIAENGVQRRITIHSLRHSYATHLLEAGVSIRHVQTYLGHATLQHTLKYLHLTQQGQEDALRAINSVMRLPKGRVET